MVNTKCCMLAADWGVAKSPNGDIRCKPSNARTEISQALQLAEQHGQNQTTSKYYYIVLSTTAESVFRAKCTVYGDWSVREAMGFYHGTNNNYSSAGKTSENHWKTTRAREKEAGRLKQSADSQRSSQVVMTLYPRNGKTFPGQTSKVLVWQREQTESAPEGERAGERQQSRPGDPTCRQRPYISTVQGL